jgi:hypothetical protein
MIEVSGIAMSSVLATIAKRNTGSNRARHVDRRD